jgi:hypothetical protein
LVISLTGGLPVPGQLVRISPRRPVFWRAARWISGMPLIFRAFLSVFHWPRWAIRVLITHSHFMMYFTTVTFRNSDDNPNESPRQPQTFDASKVL